MRRLVLSRVRHYYCNRCFLLGIQPRHVTTNAGLGEKDSWQWLNRPARSGYTTCRYINVQYRFLSVIILDKRDHAFSENLRDERFDLS